MKAIAMIPFTSLLPAVRELRRCRRSLLLCLPFLLTACNTSVVDPNLKATVAITVLDASSGAALSGALVELIAGSSSRTSTNGQVTFGEVRAGTYFVRLSLSGYETSQEMIEVATDGTENVVAVSLSETFRLHRRGVSISGRVFARPLSPTDIVNQPAVGIPVEIRVTATGMESEGTTYVRSVRLDTTSLTGAFRFDSLPEFSTFTVTVPEYVSGSVTYGPASYTIPQPTQLLAGQHFVAPVAPHFVLGPNTGVFQGFLQTTTLASALHPIQIEFTGQVDTSRLGSSSIRLQRAGVEVASTVTWADNFAQLSVRLYGGAGWQPNTTYTVSLSSIWDILGRALTPNPATFSASLRIDTVLTPVLNLRVRDSVFVRGIKVDTNVVDFATPSPYRFYWKRVPGAQGYNLYFRESLTSEWLLRDSSAKSIDTSLQYIPPTPLPNQAWNRYFMVLPKSTTQVVPYDLAANLIVRDGVKPSMDTVANSNRMLDTASDSSAYINPIAGVFRSVSLPVILKLIGNPAQNDPLDTAGNSRPRITIKEGGVQNGAGDAAYAVTPSFRWTTRLSGYVDFSVAVGRSARKDTIMLDFGDVKDLSGNAFDTLPRKPVIRFQIP
jgi:hypothetical protein